MKLLQQANRREEQANERADYWHRAYQRLNQDYIGSPIRRSLLRMQTSQRRIRAR